MTFLSFLVRYVLRTLASSYTSLIYESRWASGYMKCISQYNRMKPTTDLYWFDVINRRIDNDCAIMKLDKRSKFQKTNETLNKLTVASFSPCSPTFIYFGCNTLWPFLIKRYLWVIAVSENILIGCGRATERGCQ